MEGSFISPMLSVKAVMNNWQLADKEKSFYRLKFLFWGFTKGMRTCINLLKRCE